jgi:hypothetical protein
LQTGFRFTSLPNYFGISTATPQNPKESDKKENHGIIWIMVILGPRALSLLHFVEVISQNPHVFERKMQLTWHMDGDLAAAAPL